MFLIQSFWAEETSIPFVFASDMSFCKVTISFVIHRPFQEQVLHHLEHLPMCMSFHCDKRCTVVKVLMPLILWSCELIHWHKRALLLALIFHSASFLKCSNSVLWHFPHVSNILKINRTFDHTFFIEEWASACELYFCYPVASITVTNSLNVLNRPSLVIIRSYLFGYISWRLNMNYL